MRRAAGIFLATLPFILAFAIGRAADVERKEVSPWKVEIEPDDEQPGKYKIRGSVFAIGDPVHEVLTVTALVDGGVVKSGTTRKDRSVTQFLRGVFWNDDPCAQLFAEDDFNPMAPSFGVEWYSDFQSATKSKHPFSNLNCSLLGRSHFGDFQFLHGMADRNGVKAQETATKLLAWASLTYRVAVGELGVSANLSSDATGKALLGDFGATTMMQLLRAKTAGETRERALGSLLHMIQDSYASGHAARGAGGIEQFLSYVDQNSRKHAHDDSWREGKTELDKTLAIPGAKAALAASTEIVKLYRVKSPWSKVEAYLAAGPLALASTTRDSGPGAYK